MCRKLSEPFITALLAKGHFSSLLDRVKQDHTLDLQIRNDRVHIYYRGGKIVDINKVGENYIFHFETNYLPEEERIEPNIEKYTPSTNDCEAWVNTMKNRKEAMDLYLSQHLETEYEFQQVVVRENNYCCNQNGQQGIANGTDFFIIDTEYNNGQGAQYDLVAVEWESDTHKRLLHQDYLPKLSVIEMKYGNSALAGNAGIISHLEQWIQFFSDAERIVSFKKEMVELLQQKRMLGLIPGLVGVNNELHEFNDKVQVIFMLANHDPASKILFNVLQTIKSDYYNEGHNLPFELKFCVANFLGYGIYKEGILSLEDFMKHPGVIE